MKNKGRKPVRKGAEATEKFLKHHFGKAAVVRAG
jgi:hypothetical protein